MRNGAVATKHIFAGGSRLASKLASQPDEFGNPTTPTAGNSGQVPWGWSNGNGNGNAGGNNNAGGTTFEKDQYFFHPDHLGSGSYVTDIDGEIFQHMEYFPFGETWVEEQSNTQRTPYLFTGKELDEETGLYYFGARYYDPRTSVWQSPDPILSSYMRGEGSNGGIFTPVNLNLYGYTQQRPIILVDPDGEQTFSCGLCQIAWLGNKIGYHVANMPTREEHYAGNSITAPIPDGSVAAALESGSIIKMSRGKTILHMSGTDSDGNTFEGNVKYIDAETGQLEWVFSFKGGLVTDAVNMGTNNRVSPDDIIGHTIEDVLTYYLYGNTSNDPTYWYERLLTSYVGDVNMTRLGRSAQEQAVMDQAYESINWLYQNESGGIVQFYPPDFD